MFLALCGWRFIYWFFFCIFLSIDNYIDLGTDKYKSSLIGSSNSLLILSKAESNGVPCNYMIEIFIIYNSYTFLGLLKILEKFSGFIYSSGSVLVGLIGDNLI